MSDHNLGTPGLIYLKFWSGNWENHGNVLSWVLKFLYTESSVSFSVSISVSVLVSFSVSISDLVSVSFSVSISDLVLVSVSV